MVRFSCFLTQIHSHKPKKAVQLSAEEMHKTLEDCSKNKALEHFTNSTGMASLHLKVQEDTLPNNSADHVTNSSSVNRVCRSGEMKGKYSIGSDIGVHQSGQMKKSQSLGSGLYWKGRVSGGNYSDDETDQRYSCDGFHDHHSGVVVQVGGTDPGISVPGQYQEALLSDSLQVSSGLVNNESIFSIGDLQESEREVHENSDTQFSGECASESSRRTPRTPPVIVKSSSLPHIGFSGQHSTSTFFRSRSSEDLNVLGLRRKEMLGHEMGRHVVQDKERDFGVLSTEKNNRENPADDSYDTFNYVGSAKDWIIPVTDEVNMVRNLQGESSVFQWDELPSKDFRTKRIEEWVMDLQHCSPLDETNKLSTPNDHEVPRGDTILDGLSASRLDGKVTPGMEAAKKYLSSLSAAAMTAQLANHGLVVIPFLSAFINLRALNLSGNSIARITAGALPRGLHILNLSKNKISSIEGLRELARLRVLDLSYNRIFRIGHGLASCSSLKELYLAGNKISEVEGLHRLLKLNVLDMRFNKISTAKCLGQLAANYNSLQAISLEGNPAQKNVGDEQIKKYLQGLLPHLTCFNRQSIRASTLKDAAERSARLGIGAHQIDRGLRSELKTMRKGIHATHKMPSSANHGRRSQAVTSTKPSMGRHGCLPPSGTKTGSHRRHIYDFSSKLLSLRSDLSVRRSRSEGTLGAI